MDSTAPDSEAAVTAERFDVLIVGAGISGIGAAYHLSKQCTDRSFVVLEAQESFGGTWLTHKYPGIRSDSDLHTFGYGFKPWRGPPIATAAEILAYLGEVIDENGLASLIRYKHRIESAHWSSAGNLWTLDVTRTDTGERMRFAAKFLWMCQGYYAHAQGYTPRWDGTDAFEGRIVHPQTWPDDLDVAGKQVVVVGSGATAATIVPAMAGTAAHVIMLQRSPTYFLTGRNANLLADTLREIDIDETWIHEIVRKKILHDQAAFTKRTFSEPDVVSRELLAGVRAHLGDDYDIDTHFTPRYRPWRQRIAFVPDADLFAAVREGQASVVTDEIARFTPKGILLKSGEELRADVVVTATGFNLSVMGDIPFTVDGAPLDFAQTVTYQGMMFTGVPNMAWVFGYFRASWTLRSDLVAEFVCRLLNHMTARGVSRVVPRLRDEDREMVLSGWVDPNDFNPGYLNRGIDRLPKSGDKPEWRHTQDYWSDKDAFPTIDLDDRALSYA